MNVLVTGATGFTGGHLVRALDAAGHSVRALVRDAARIRELGKRGVEVIQGDLRDEAALTRAVEGVEVVYNIAAIYRQAALPNEAYRAVNAMAGRTATAGPARQASNGERRATSTTPEAFGRTERPVSAAYRPNGSTASSNNSGSRRTDQGAHAEFGG